VTLHSRGGPRRRARLGTDGPASERCRGTRSRRGRLGSEAGPRRCEHAYLPHSSQFENNYFTEMCSGSEAGSYLRLIDLCITQLR